MSIALLEDTARNTLASWGADAVSRGVARGVVLNPFCSPYVSNRYKPSAQRQAEQIHAAGGEVWFDPMTHALQMPGVGDFRYYEQWTMWDEDGLGVLGTRAQRRDHLLRLFDHQAQLGAQPLAPTVLLTSPTDQAVVAAIALLEDALDLEPNAAGAMAGTPEFWSGEQRLDALVGTVAQVGATSWFLTVARQSDNLPPRASATEIAGVCRTVRGLAELGRVHLSFSDLAGLPGIAAGASTVGTGWDSRQRLCHFGSYTERSEAGSGGAWFQRPTVHGLFAFLPRADVERLFARDADLALRIFDGPLHPDGPHEAFDHHLDVLQQTGDDLEPLAAEQKFVALDGLYSQSLEDWRAYAEVAQVSNDAGSWVEPLQSGLREYASEEGW